MVVFQGPVDGVLMGVSMAGIMGLGVLIGVMVHTKQVENEKSNHDQQHISLTKLVQNLEQLGAQAEETERTNGHLRKRMPRSGSASPSPFNNAESFAFHAPHERPNSAGSQPGSQTSLMANGAENGSHNKLMLNRRTTLQRGLQRVCRLVYLHPDVRFLSSKRESKVRECMHAPRIINVWVQSICRRI
jgi:hypothetical protein